MREIKFRAWDKVNHKMVNVSTIDFRTMHVSHACHGTYGQINEGILEPILMQYTGLKDKNGKEIYEGDIVKNYKENVEIVKWGHFTESVNYNEYSNSCYGYYVGNDDQYEDFEQINGGNWEIIGNIYENPELLESNQK